MEDEEKEEEGEEDKLHTVYLQLYPELIVYPCLFVLTASDWSKFSLTCLIRLSSHCLIQICKRLREGGFSSGSYFFSYTLTASKSLAVTSNQLHLLILQTLCIKLGKTL